MKTTWLWLALIFAVQSQAQNITGCEYFFDTDPGLGNGTSLGITPADSIVLTTTISTNSLSTGFHKLFVRTMIDDGTWSLYEGRTIYLQGSGENTSAQMVEAEYFYDTDPGQGNGTALPTTPGDSLLIDTNVPTTSLSPGFHKLIVRAKNQEGKWSLYETRTFYIQSPIDPITPQLSEAEYFYDTDPGFGNGTAFTVTTGDSLMFNASVPTDGLAEGFHKLLVRAKNTSGVWSLYEGRTVYIQNPNSPDLQQLTAAEYFYDIDPGIGNGTGFVVTASDSLIIETNNDITGLSDGFHKLFVRAQNNEGTWSLYEGRTFFIQNTPDPDTLTIVAAEYYFDEEPGLGLGTVLDIIPGDSIDASFSIPQSLSIGMHTMYIRVKSSNGDWSLFEARECEDIEVGVDENNGANYALYQNFPNPFHSSTQFEFYLHKATEVKIQILDVSGKMIKEIPLQKVNSGQHLVHLDLSEFSEGYYFYKLISPEYTETKQMLLTK